MKSEFSRETLKKEIEYDLITYKFVCDGCKTATEYVTPQQGFGWHATPNDWSTVYTDRNTLVLCKDCSEKRKEYKKTVEFRDKQEMVEDILRFMESYYRTDGDSISYAYSPEPEELDDILTFLKEALKDD